MPVRIADRLVYVNTQDTQTVEICTAQNVQGQYEKYYRILPPRTLPQPTMERRLQGFQSIADLEKWLVDGLEARRESKHEVDGEQPQPVLPSGHLPYLFLGADYPLDVRLVTDKTREALAENLLNCYAKIKDNLRTAIERETVRPGGRGQLRQVTDLSLARIRANVSKGHDWELTLERTIVETQKHRSNRRYEWWNQFNVASGIYGSHGGTRVAIDLIRQSHFARHFDLIELKAWGAGDDPYDAAWEIVRYCFAFIILGKEREDPCYGHLNWPPLEKANLFVLAPDTWHGQDADDVMQLFHDAFRVGGIREPALSCCAFWPRVLRLTGISVREFRNMLYSPKPRNGYSNLYQVEGRIERIHKWIDDAFRDVERERGGG
jgi:hypothetical protein